MVTTQTDPRYRVTQEVQDPGAVSALAPASDARAVVLFSGIVRDNNLGRSVEHPEHDAYPQLAERPLLAIAEDARSRWSLTEVAIYHRVGRLEIGEASLLVAVS